MIKGDLVGLRAIERSDLELLRDWRNLPDLRRNFREYRELNMENQARWFDSLQQSGNTNFMFMIERLKDKEPLGACGLLYVNWINRSSDLSFYIGHQETYIDNEGYAQEAASLLIDYGFSVLNLHKIWMELYEFDDQKLKFFTEHFDFKKDGKLRDNCFEGGRYWDSFIISLLKKRANETFIRTNKSNSNIDMSNRTQKDAFLSYEADNYFQRNKTVEYDAENDVILKVLKEYKTHPKNVLEIGCSTGYRLNALENYYSAKVSGIEPSSEAIASGKSAYPKVDFYKGTVDNMNQFTSSSFDLVIIGFVLYVVDREILFQAISETDRVLKDGGILMIIDFFSEKPIRNAYEHIKDIEAYAFKQNYDDIFVASKLYHLCDKRSMNHATKEFDLTGDYHHKYTLTTLRKDLLAGYK